MTLEQMEVQIADFLTKAKKMQIRAQQLQRQGIMVARQSEVVVREKLNNYLEDGLNLLGKSIVKGRKLKESLAAETHRKMASLKKEAKSTEETNSAGAKKMAVDGIKSELLKKALPVKSPIKKMAENSAVKKNKIKPKKTPQHFSNASRAR